jgi:glutaredoxin 3
MFCNGVKEFLSRKGIDFIERDVAQDEEAMRELEALGVLATPVTLVNGEIVVGFDKPKLERLLGLSDNSK